ncbi:MAG: hypothetical protein R3C53_05295 [Pirellulaceae bacterium]
MPLRILIATVLAAASIFAPRINAQEEERHGIATNYPGDQGIERDQRVVFSENFELPSVAAIGQRWEMVRDASVMSLTADVPKASSGKQSLLMSQLAENGHGGDLYSRLGEGHNQLFTRMYVKFAEDCEPIHHFGTCVGGNHPSTAWPTVRAGQPQLVIKDSGLELNRLAKCGNGTTTHIGVKCGSPPRRTDMGNSFIHDASSKFDVANGSVSKSWSR